MNEFYGANLTVAMVGNNGNNNTLYNNTVVTNSTGYPQPSSASASYTCIGLEGSNNNVIANNIYYDSTPRDCPCDPDPDDPDSPFWIDPILLTWVCSIGILGIVVTIYFVNRRSKVVNH